MPIPFARRQGAQADRIGGDVKILVVDDDFELAGTLVRFLTRAGHSCVTVISYQEAMHRLSWNHPDVVIADYQLPDGNGLEFLKTVHQKYPRTPVIMITGNHCQPLEEAAHNTGVAAYLRKPFSLTLLSEALRSV